MDKLLLTSKIFRYRLKNTIISKIVDKLPLYKNWNAVTGIDSRIPILMIIFKTNLFNTLKDEKT